MAKVANSNLHGAKKAKKDEFYTQLSDIENELMHYKGHFRGKTVLCNCDDPKVSQFFRYFANKFYDLGLEKLIATCYKNVSGEEFHHELEQNLFKGKKKFDGEKSCYLEYEGKDDNGEELRENKKIDEFITKLSPKPLLNDKEYIKNTGGGGGTTLYPAGDFRSLHCIELLKKADIVVTNPPFSLFREYVAQLVEYKKKFLIIGNMNAITYKEIFKLIKEKKVWCGYGFNISMIFKASYKNTLESNRKFVKAKGYDPNDNFIKTPAIFWLTNLTHKKRTEILETVTSYKKEPEKYPKYDNYDAINVDKTMDIPLDYDGIMGVPITFLDKHNPKQFEIVALGIVGSIDFTCNKKMEILDKFGNGTGKFTFNAKGTLYRKFNPVTDKTPAFKDCESGELYSSIYARILIRKIAEVNDLRKEEQEKLKEQK